MGILASIGAAFFGFLANIGQVAIFALAALRAALTPPFYPATFGRALMNIGYYSLPVVGLTAIFTGAALALQIYTGSSDLNAATVTPFIAALGMVRELGPVLGGLMVAGRVSSSIAAELGTMRVTEQIDALTTLNVDPMRYLVAPRIIAAVIALPILVAIGDILGIYGSYLVGTGRLGFGSAAYIAASINPLEFWDIGSGLVKAAVFGFFLALMGCYMGFHSRGGAAGVGRATTFAVVTASILILASNYLLTELFFAS